MRNFSPRDKSIAICDGQAPEDGDLPQKRAERFLKKPSELEIQAEEFTASDFGSNGPRFESGRGRCVESLDKALYSHCPKEKPSH